MKSTTGNYRENIVSLCPVESGHNDFLLKLFKECRSDLALIGGINEKQKDDIIFQQFTIEQKQLSKMYPDAEFNIVMFKEKPVGRFYVYHDEIVDRILEIGLLEKYRSLGIGKRLMITAIENAVKKRKTLCLQVTWFNQGAYLFYKKLGFKVIQDNGVFLEMKHNYNFV